MEILVLTKTRAHLDKEKRHHMLDINVSIFSPGQVYSQSRVFSENVYVIMVENGGRK